MAAWQPNGSPRSPTSRPSSASSRRSRGAALTEQLAGADERLAKLAETLNERGGVGFATEGSCSRRSGRARRLIKMMRREREAATSASPPSSAAELLRRRGQPVAAGPPADGDGDRRVGRRRRGVGALQDAGRRDGPTRSRSRSLELGEKRYETPEEAVEAFVACLRQADRARALERAEGRRLEARHPRVGRRHRRSALMADDFRVTVELEDGSGRGLRRATLDEHELEEETRRAARRRRSPSAPTGRDRLPLRRHARRGRAGARRRRGRSSQRRA